jgi:excisionase family DNA binding protein
LTLKEVALLLNVTPLTLRRWVLAGKVKPEKVGKKHLFKRDSIYKDLLGQDKIITSKTKSWPIYSYPERPWQGRPPLGGEVQRDDDEPAGVLLYGALYQPSAP